MRTRLKRPGSAILVVASVLAAGLILFASENLWLDRLVRSRWHRLPSFVPEEGSTSWMVVFGLMGLSSALLLVCQVFVIKDRELTRDKKWGSVFLSICALVLFGLWFRSTGMSASSAVPSARSPHKVTLKWNASTSAVDGYHVYRSDAGGEFRIISGTNPWPYTSFVDSDVRSGGHYRYQVTAIAGKKESVASNEVEVTVP